MSSLSGKRILLRIWRDVPFPNWLRQIFLRLLNPSVMVGAMALIQDVDGRILILEHTYRRELPWGLPGGWLKLDESPEAGLIREVFEETHFRVRVAELLAVDVWDRSQLDLLFRCEVLSGAYQPSEETATARWVAPADMPELLPNQARLLRKSGLIR
jgi:ADP-ribose pyrophosphatase YjhB (NUDIX family)